MTETPEIVESSKAASLADIDNWASDMKGWIFRGQRDSTWHLTTSIERMLMTLPEQLSKAEKRELGILRRFRRTAHHYLPHVPDYHDLPEWLSILQHHGGPTRLQDWSHSFDVALFFAVIDQTVPFSSVWALDWARVDSSVPDRVKELFKDDRNCSDKGAFIELTKCGPGVAKVNSRRFNERQAVQQSTFIAPLSLKHTFKQNLAASLDKSSERFFRRLDIPISLRLLIVEKLYRRNVHDGTLFPGLDGLAMSLRSMIAVPHLLYPGDGW